MKTLFAIVLTGGVFAAASSAQPVITQISNAASALIAPLPNANIAQGAFMAIYGTGLAASTGATWSTTYPLNPTPGLNGSTVTVTPSGAASGTNALIYYAGPGGTSTQINAVMPSSITPGPAMVTVSFGGQSSSAYPVNVISSTLGTFAQNYAGSGPGIITDVNYIPFNPFHTAKAADAVILWGSGLGPSPDVANEGISGPCPDACDFRPGQPTSIAGANLEVNVYVGGITATVAYAGRAPGLTALDQIVFIVPDGITGCYVPVAVTSGPTGTALITSNFASMTIDPSGTSCSDADGINFADISTAVTSKGSAAVAAVSLLSNYVPLNVFGSILEFDNDTVNALIGSVSSGVLDAFQGFTISPSPGTCTVAQFLGFPPPVDPELSPSVIHYLDAGSTLTISGGQGPNPTQSIPMNTNGEGYGALVGGSSIANLVSGNGTAPYFLTSTSSNGQFTPTGIAASTYTVTGSGGADVASFSSSLQVSSDAAAFSWTNSSITSSSISRSTPLTITWTGGDSSGFVDITLIASGTQQALLPLATDPGVLVECVVPAGPGSFSVPTYVLQAMPSTTSTPSPVAGEILVGPASGAQPFSTIPGGLDAAYMFYHFIAGTGASWQ